jgi:lipopolysaccharide export system permease protein
LKIFKHKIDLSSYVAPFVGFVLVAILPILLFCQGFCEAHLGIHRDAIYPTVIFDVACLTLYLNRLKIHKLILRSFVGPFLIAFSVILFVLVLQFLARYMEDIMGKGLEGSVLAKVFGLACLTLVTLALPLGILLSSLLTMGNMGERYELAALKSNGIGLFKAIRPLIHATAVITIGSVFFSFFVTPMANLKLYTLLYDLSKVKPTFQLKPNHFYNGIDGMVVHVGDINRETDTLTRIKIFDHTDQVGNNRITIAAKGKMVSSKATGYLDITLLDGQVYERAVPEGGGSKAEQTQVFMFDTLMYKVALQGFNLEQSDEETFSNHHYMLNIFELGKAIDSLGRRNDIYFDEYADFNRKYIHLDTIMNRSLQAIMEGDSAGGKKDSMGKGANEAAAAKDISPPDISPPDTTRKIFGALDQVRLRRGDIDDFEPDDSKPVWTWFTDIPPKDLISKTINQVQALENYTKIMVDRLNREGEKMRKFKIEQHTRWMLPASCFVFLFLGASLGAIIRKGGIGVPVICSIIFFILFYILMIQGKKLAREDVVPLWVGVWLPVIVMLPMALFFTWQSATESPILYRSNWYKLERLLLKLWPFGRKKRNQPQHHTMTIEELIAYREKSKADARKAIEEHQMKK